MFIHVQIKINARSYIYTIIHIYKVTNAHTHICTHKIHVNKRIYIHTYINSCTYSCTHTLTHTDINARTYTTTDVHIQSDRDVQKTTEMQGDFLNVLTLKFTRLDVVSEKGTTKPP